MIELGGPLDQALDLTHLAHLPSQVLVQAIDRAADNLELIKDEIAEVALIRLGQEKRPGVFGRCPSEDGGDG